MKERISKKRVIIFFITAILPILSIADGCLLLFADGVFNLSFAVTYVIVPMVSIALLALIIFEVKKALPKVILSVLVLIAFVVSLFLSVSYLFVISALKKSKKIVNSVHTVVSITKNIMPRQGFLCPEQSLRINIS